MLSKWYEMISCDFDCSGAVGLMCVGSCEQHSEYLPVGTDGMLGESVCEDAARLCRANVIMLPTQRVGYSPHHRKFKGYITISQDALFHYLTEYCRCAFENGLKRLVIVNAHGGNQSCLQTVVNELGATDGYKAVLLRYWDLITDVIGTIRESRLGGMGHAGELETSLMLYYHPELVDSSRFGVREGVGISPYYSPEMFAKSSVYLFKPFDEYSDKGNIGQPQFASAEKGRQIAGCAAARLAELIDYYAEEKNEY